MWNPKVVYNSVLNWFYTKIYEEKLKNIQITIEKLPKNS